MAAINFPSSPSLDDTFTANDILFKWDGAKWIAQYSTFRTGSTPPAGPENGDLWWNSEKANLYIYYDDGDSAQWVTAARGTKGEPGDSADFSSVAENIIPADDVTYDLGSSTNRWKDLYLSGSTIDLGGALIEADDATGAMVLIPKPTVGTPNPTATVISPAGKISTVSTINGVVDAGDVTTALTTAVTPGTVSAQTSNTSSNFKVPFLNTTSNSAGTYTVLHDTSTSFTYNPSTNTLNNFVLGTSVTVPGSILPGSQQFTRGAVYGGTAGLDSVGVGYGAYAGSGSVALGYYAEVYTNYSIGIGNVAISSYTNTIALNATSSTFTPSSSGFFVNGIESGTASDVLYYDNSTKQITYGTAPSGGGGGSLNDLSDVVISSPSAGQVLTYDGTNWVNVGGGGAEVTSGDGVTWVDATFVDGTPHNINIYFNSSSKATDFFNAVTQNIPALSSLTTFANDVYPFAIVKIPNGIQMYTIKFYPSSEAIAVNSSAVTAFASVYDTPYSGGTTGNWTYADSVYTPSGLFGYGYSGGNAEIHVDASTSIADDFDFALATIAPASDPNTTPATIRLTGYDFYNSQYNDVLLEGVDITAVVGIGGGVNSIYITYNNAVNLGTSPSNINTIELRAYLATPS